MVLQRQASGPMGLAGWILSAGVGIFLLHSAGTKFLHTAAVRAEFEHLGYPESVITPIAVAQALGILLYLFPRTGTLGAVLITAYMGGGTAIHLRAGDGVALPMVTGVLAWAGLLLRDAQVRRIIPWRTGGPEVQRGQDPSSDQGHRQP